MYALVLGICFNMVLAFVLRDAVDAAVTGDREILFRDLALAVGTLLGGLPILTISRATRLRPHYFAR